MVNLSDLRWHAAAQAVRENPDDLLTLAAFGDYCLTSSRKHIFFLGRLTQAFLSGEPFCTPSSGACVSAASELAKQLGPYSKDETLKARFQSWLHGGLFERWKQTIPGYHNNYEPKQWA
jgi:hypothetical protein